MGRLEELLTIARPMVKGHIRQTRTLLGVLTELDKELDLVERRIAEEAQRDDDRTPHLTAA